jgi:hypothetical protein
MAVFQPPSAIECSCSSSETLPLLLLFWLLPLLPLLESPRAVFSRGIVLLFSFSFAPARLKVYTLHIPNWPLYVTPSPPPH